MRQGSALVIGYGGREHALAWALERSGRFERVYTMPGNAGTPYPTPLPGDLPGAGAPSGGNMADSVAGFARAHGVELVVIGPEAPLAAGLADELRMAGLQVVGPSREAARIEWSKVFAKRLMDEAGVPTAPFRVFVDPDRAIAYVRNADRPLVVKADGLAAGKGVFVCEGPQEAERAVRALMVERAMGDAGRTVIVEERLQGQELSVMVLTDGERVVYLPPARDHKRLLDGDRGPNTGGMGAVAPILEGPGTGGGLEEVVRCIVRPVLGALARAGAPYSGILYAGLMLTEDGPQVLEFNCRAGDPETQAQLPLVDEGRFAEALLAVGGAPHRLLPDDPGWLWKPVPPAGGVTRHTVAVVLTSAGYPDHPRTGDPIDGMTGASPEAGEAGDAESLVFHAATHRRPDGHVTTAGGRVLTVVGLGASRQQARERAYQRVERIRFQGVQYRSDIGMR